MEDFDEMILHYGTNRIWKYTWHCGLNYKIKVWYFKNPEDGNIINSMELYRNQYIKIRKSWDVNGVLLDDFRYNKNGKLDGICYRKMGRYKTIEFWINGEFKGYNLYD